MAKTHVIAGMATMPSRIATAENAIYTIASQVDKLFLFLDKFDDIPGYALLPNIEILTSQEFGDLGAAGKLLGLQSASPSDIYLFADDDVKYPPNFAKKVCDALTGRHKDAVVGFHGSRLFPPVNSYLRDREVTQLSSRLWFPRKVDVVATCAGGIRCHKIDVDVRTWPYKNMVDIQFALAIKNLGMDSILLPRRKKWIYFAASRQADSIYASLRKDDTTQTRLANQLLSINESS